MEPIRKTRIESVIHHELVTLLQREVHDPRVKRITIIKVELSRDGSYAKIQYSLYPIEDPVIASDCQAGLKSASPFLRHELKTLLRIKNVPQLIFEPHTGAENSIRISQILRTLKQ